MTRFHSLMTGLAFLFAFSACASQALTTEKLSDFYERALREGAKHGNERVLLVYDVDNTLLASKQDLGSDQWHDWQVSLLSQEGHPDRVASDMPELLRHQYKLYFLSGMRPVEPDAPAKLSQLHDLGFPQIVLTARSPEMREATLRDLKQNGFNFDRTPSAQSITRVYLPYSQENPEKYCLRKEELSRLKLGAPRPISFGSGVIMAAGQNKGAILRTYLCDAPTPPAVILFLDDKVKNTEAMQAAYSGLNTEVISYRYGAEDKNVAEFHHSDKETVRQQWKKLQKTLHSIFAK